MDNTTRTTYSISCVITWLLHLATSSEIQMHNNTQNNCQSSINIDTIRYVIKYILHPWVQFTIFLSTVLRVSGGNCKWDCQSNLESGVTAGWVNATKERRITTGGFLHCEIMNGKMSAEWSPCSVIPPSGALAKCSISTHMPKISNMKFYWSG